ncbi:MAG: hypothetical protein IKL10_01640 [Clostridia bacterium]|nr:hypothetical protein [Clostridia bacterium]
MKKKKNYTENQNTPLPSHIQNQLRRRQEKLEKEAKKNEKSRNALFRRRVRDASDKKAPKTLRTKAYYRFSENYPSVVTPDGFRENTTEKHKLSHKKRLFVFISCVLIFVLSFTLIKTCILLSEKEIEPQPDTPVITDSTAIAALHITPEELASKTADELLKTLNAAQCNTAVFEFKSEYGYVYFDIKSFLGGSADKKIVNAWDTVKALTDNGIVCAAYISCFKDTVAASALIGMQAATSSGNIFLDSSNSGWLDPFSDEAHKYLLDIIKKASEGGFSYIILDNICFPTEYTVSAPVYNWGDITADSKNKRLVSFINSAVKEVGTEKIIPLCDISGFSPLSQLPNEKYGNILLSSDSLSFCVDLRQDKQYTAQLENSEHFNYIEEMPLAFILDAGAIAVKQLKEEKEASVAFALIDKDLQDAAKFTQHAGIENIIYW